LILIEVGELIDEELLAEKTQVKLIEVELILQGI
jgi:hypothetical protein